MFTTLLDWLKPLITGFASAWSWLTEPLFTIPGINLNFVGVSHTTDAWSVSPIGVISVGGFAVLFVFGVVKTILDAIPVV